MRQKYFSNSDSSHPSLIRRLLIGLNLTVVLIMAVFILWDYYAGRGAMLRQQRIALREQALTILATLEKSPELEANAVQEYIDAACIKMEETTSPGHHIVVVIGEKVIQAQAHGHHSPERWEAMQRGVDSDDGLAAYGDDEFVVAEAGGPDMTVYVSKETAVVYESMRGHMRMRVLSILLVAFVIIIVVSVGLGRFLAHPLEEMVDVVKKFRSGQRGLSMPRSYPQELGIMAEEFGRMMEATEKAEKDRAERMGKARCLQERLHPDIEDVPGFEIETLFEPAEEVAGDFYDVIPLSDGKILFCMGDVSGHGVPAAMSACMLKISLSDVLKSDQAAHKIMLSLNQKFIRTALDEDFASLILVLWDAESGQLSYAAAGHEICYLLRPDGDGFRILDLKATGIVLGVEETTTWETIPLEVGKKDMLVLFTDGMVEARSETDAQFGRERVRELIRKNINKRPAELMNILSSALADHCGTAPRADDVTLLAARKNN